MGAVRLQLARVQEDWQHRIFAAVGITAELECSEGPCPQCGGPTEVQKSCEHRVVTLEHGDFIAHETVHVCKAPLRPGEVLCPEVIESGLRIPFFAGDTGGRRRQKRAKCCVRIRFVVLVDSRHTNRREMPARRPRPIAPRGPPSLLSALKSISSPVFWP